MNESSSMHWGAREGTLITHVCPISSTVITDLTVGPDGCGGWAIYVGWGGAGPEEAPTYCGSQSSPEGILEGQQGQENPEVPTRNSCPLGDLPVQKEHWAPHLEIPLLAVSLKDSPWSGQVWSTLPGACYNMLAGSCRGIYSRSHGRHEPLCHAYKQVTIMPKDIQLAQCIHGEHLSYWNPPQSLVWSFCWL